MECMAGDSTGRSTSTTRTMSSDAELAGDRTLPPPAQTAITKEQNKTPSLAATHLWFSGRRERCLTQGLGALLQVASTQTVRSSHHLCTGEESLTVPDCRHKEIHNASKCTQHQTYGGSTACVVEYRYDAFLGERERARCRRSETVVVATSSMIRTAT